MVAPHSNHIGAESALDELPNALRRRLWYFLSGLRQKRRAPIYFQCVGLS